MKQKILAVLMFLNGGLSMASTLKVEVKGIDPKKGGQVIVFIFSKKGFPKLHSEAIARSVQLAEKENLFFDFADVPEEFAIKVLHDEDQNGEVTKNWTGLIPKEGLGFSKDQKIGIFGPPKYENCKLVLNSTSSPIIISIVYPGKEL